MEPVNPTQTHTRVAAVDRRGTAPGPSFQLILTLRSQMVRSSSSRPTRTSLTGHHVTSPLLTWHTRCSLACYPTPSQYVSPWSAISPIRGAGSKRWRLRGVRVRSGRRPVRPGMCAPARVKVSNPRGWRCHQGLASAGAVPTSSATGGAVVDRPRFQCPILFWAPKCVWFECVEASGIRDG